VQIFFLIFTFFGDWILIAFARTTIYIVQRFIVHSKNSLPVMDGTIWLIAWDIFRATTPLLIAAALQFNIVTIVASVILTCITVLSIILNFLMKEKSSITEVLSAVIDEKSDEKNAVTPKQESIDFVKQFHAQFAWNATTHNEKKDVRHRV
jgi:hypothetical protein